MTYREFTINENGELDPPSLDVNKNDIISFEAIGSDIVLIFEPSILYKMFGVKRIEIPKSEKVTLVVKDDAPQIPMFDSSHFFYCCHDLTYQFPESIAGRGTKPPGSSGPN